jgi:hypothetical protein
MENNIYYSRNGYNPNYPYNGGTSEQVTPATTQKDWCAIKQQIAYILGQAELDWFEVYDPKYPNGRVILESEKLNGSYRMLSYLEEYWKAVRGISANPPSYQNINPATEALYSAQSHPERGIWSAAFVSWVMRESGIEESDGFAFSVRHITYVVQALSNARKNDFAKPIWLLDNSTPVEVGDILCFNRSVKGRMTNHTLNGLARNYLDANNNIKNLEHVRGSSHCDVVKEIIVENGKKYAIVIGGNKGRGTVTTSTNPIELLDNNAIKNPSRVRNPGSCFGIIKVGTSCASSTSSPTRENYNENIFINSSRINSSVGINCTNNRNDVQIIQELLKNIGYPLNSNGSISNSQTDNTILSIINFQANNSLRITGTILPNDATLNLLIQRNNVNNLTESDDESVHQPFITNAFTFRRNAGNTNTLNVIFEGDSWLDYPIPRVLDLYDTISSRNQRLNLNCLHLAKFGETTTDMYNDRSRFQEYVTNYRIDRIYFSGGGNDVFPNLTRIVRPGPSFNQSFFSDPNKYLELRNIAVGDELNRKCIQYKNYLNTTAFDSSFFNSTNLNNIFSVIKNNYLRFGNIVNNTATPNLIFYMHTYDYPIYKLGVQPSLGVSLPIGPWVKPAFDRLGITDPVLINFIVIRLLDKFYRLLYKINNMFIASGFRFQTRIIDYRGLLNSSEYWRDEIHPNSNGASRLATRVNF